MIVIITGIFIALIICSILFKLDGLNDIQNDD
jgi:hypothetical protein